MVAYVVVDPCDCSAHANGARDSSARDNGARDSSTRANGTRYSSTRANGARDSSARANGAKDSSVHEESRVRVSCRKLCMYIHVHESRELGKVVYPCTADSAENLRANGLIHVFPLYVNVPIQVLW